MIERYSEPFGTSLEPALVTLPGTCGDSNWRLPLIEQLVELGVPDCKIHNPAMSTWKDQERFVEQYQIERAGSVVMHIGDSGGGQLPRFSMPELVDIAYRRPDSLLAIIDDQSLYFSAHDRKVLGELTQSLRAISSEIPIVKHASEALPWLAGRLDLGKKLAELGLKHAMGMIDAAEQSGEIDYEEAKAATLARRKEGCVMGIVSQILSQVDRCPDWPRWSIEDTDPLWRDLNTEVIHEVRRRLLPYGLTSVEYYGFNNSSGHCSLVVER